MVCAQIKELGSLSSLSAAFITRRTVMPRVPSAKHTQLNAILIYNLRNQQYNKLDSYRLDSYWLSSLLYSMIAYNRDNIAPFNKLYPPVTRIQDINPSTNTTCSGTVMDIPIHPNMSLHYLIQFKIVPPNQFQLLIFCP
jgi:hypothetical protein